MQTQPLRNFYGNDTELETVLPPQCGVVNVIKLFTQPSFKPVLKNVQTTWKNITNAYKTNINVFYASKINKSKIKSDCIFIYDYIFSDRQCDRL